MFSTENNNQKNFDYLKGNSSLILLVQIFKYYGTVGMGQLKNFLSLYFIMKGRVTTNRLQIVIWGLQIKISLLWG